MKTIKVYIAGPYTKPDPVENTHAAIHLAGSLMDLGYVPFCPHLTLAWHLVAPRPYEEWLDYDMEWLRLCDAVYRIPGESAGADKEVAEARRLGIPVVGTLYGLARVREALTEPKVVLRAGQGPSAE